MAPQIPWTIVTLTLSRPTLTKRRVGRFTTIFNMSQCLPEIFVGLFSGVLVKFTGKVSGYLSKELAESTASCTRVWEAYPCDFDRLECRAAGVQWRTLIVLSLLCTGGLGVCLRRNCGACRRRLMLLCDRPTRTGIAADADQKVHRLQIVTGPAALFSGSHYLLSGFCLNWILYPYGLELLQMDPELRSQAFRSPSAACTAPPNYSSSETRRRNFAEGDEPGQRRHRCPTRFGRLSGS